MRKPAPSRPASPPAGALEAEFARVAGLSLDELRVLWWHMIRSTSPGHANKRGVRYRYYVSQVLLQNRKKEAGSVARVSAPDLEEMVVAALRQRMSGDVRHDLPPRDRDGEAEPANIQMSGAPLPISP